MPLRSPHMWFQPIPLAAQACVHHAFADADGCADTPEHGHGDRRRCAAFSASLDEACLHESVERFMQCNEIATLCGCGAVGYFGAAPGNIQGMLFAEEQ
eukprot:4061071-Prymnesium_polylepis.1